MISVVMATYNGAKFIGEQLESILNQSIIPDEIIIRDDCSDDNTVSIIRNILHEKFPNIVTDVRINEKRLGYAGNFRKAINCAHGEIIFLSDQDDVWISEKIEKCMEIFDRNSEVLALSTGFYITDAKLLNRKSSDHMQENSLKRIKWKSFIKHPKYPGMAMAFRRSVWKEIDKSDWKGRAAHDWMINQYAASLGGMYKIGGKYVLYRQHDTNAEGTIKNSSQAGILTRRLRLIEELKDELESIDDTVRDGGENNNSDSIPKDKTNSTKTTDMKNQNYVRKMISFEKERYKLMEQRNLIRLLMHEILHPDCISLRSILGDAVVILRSVKNRVAGNQI